MQGGRIPKTGKLARVSPNANTGPLKLTHLPIPLSHGLTQCITYFHKRFIGSQKCIVDSHKLISIVVIIINITNLLGVHPHAASHRLDLAPAPQPMPPTLAAHFYVLLARRVKLTH
eukprot:scaffold86245_cov19-Tisochrysis_lutea.AAC.2